MTGLPGGAFFVGVRGLAGAWRVLDGFLTGSWRVLGGFLAGANMRPKMAFAGWEGLAFERGGRVLAFAGWRVWLSKGVGEAGCSGMGGLGMLGAGCSGVWGWAWLATFPFAVWCFTPNPLPLQSLKPRRRHRGAHATVSTQTLTIIINLKTQKNNYGSILS